ncbi:MAG: hypothetical protein WHT65_09655 [Pseudothermotoga sp.]
MVGFSEKINDPAYEKYKKASAKWAYLFSLILAAIAIIAFPIYAQSTKEITLPQGFLYGLVIGGMFVLIAFFQNLKRKKDTTWDGVVLDKKDERRVENVRSGNRIRQRDYMLYTLKVMRDDGKTFTHKWRDNSSIYDYYQVGERVRHHKGFPYYEKFDKSKDSKILCIACLTFNDIHDDFCKRCKVPLLK